MSHKSSLSKARIFNHDFMIYWFILNFIALTNVWDESLSHHCVSTKQKNMYALTVGWGSTRNYNFICKDENTSEAKTILIFSIFFLNAYRYTWDYSSLREWDSEIPFRGQDSCSRIWQDLALPSPRPDILALRWINPTQIYNELTFIALFFIKKNDFWLLSVMTFKRLI